MGSRKNPVWRVVVADQRSPRDGRVIETIGRYNPQSQPSEIVIQKDRLDFWLERGAQPTSTVRNLIRALGSAPPPEDAASGQEEPVEEAPVAEEAPAAEAEAPADAEPAAADPTPTE